MQRLIQLYRRWRRRDPHPSPLVREYRRACADPPWSTPIDRLAVTVVDCEMSGLVAGRDHLLAIGSVPVRDNRILVGDAYYRLLKPPPELTLAPDNVLIHRLGADALQQGADLDTVLDEWLPTLGGDVLIGHALRLDLKFLNRAYHHRYGIHLANVTLDTARLYRWYRRRQDPHVASDQDPQGLDFLARHFQLPEYPRHHAAGDALTTACLYLKLVHACHQAGLHTLRDLHRAAGV